MDSYAQCVRASEQVAWTLEETLPADASLNVDVPFMPWGMCASIPDSKFSAEHRLTLNQIYGNSYLNLFAVLETYIAADAANRAIASQFGNDNAFRAFLRFADEEVKHRMLFTRFRELFARTFPSRCEVLRNALEIANTILCRSPAAITLVTLHFELITQAHYTSYVQADAIDPLFAKMLHNHWLEESQHVKLDILELGRIAPFLTEKTRHQALVDYREILHGFSQLLRIQSELDADSMVRAHGNDLKRVRDETIDYQHQTYLKSLLQMGLGHPRQQAILTGQFACDPAWIVSLEQEIMS